jgi:hypothetical protein
MRKIVLILPIMFLLAASSMAQTSVELIPSVGYTFPARNDFYNDYGRLGGGLNLGGQINFNVNRSFGFELLYNHLSTTTGVFNYGYDNGTQINGGNLNQDYIMGGFVFSGNIPGSTVRPFVGLLLGADILTPQTTGYTSNSYFAAGFQLGMNIYCSPRVGIQVKAQFLSPVSSAGGAYYFNNYYGGGIDPTQSIYSFTLGAGVIIGLGRVLPAQVYRPRPRRPHYYRYGY